MTTSMPEGHVAPAQLSGYAAGGLSTAQEAELEQHLIACPECRRLVAAAGPVDVRRLDAVWNEVVDVLDRPRCSLAERVLQRLGASGETARLVAAAPSLRLPWMASVAVCLLLAVAAAAAGGVRGSWVFLSLAPLLPVAGVLAAYGRHSDPAWELAQATHYSLSRLALLRSVAVVASTLPLAVLCGALLPSADWWVAAAWLLPSLAFVTVSLWVGTYVQPLPAATVLAAGWLVATSDAMLHRASPEVLLHPGVQFGFAAALVVAAVGLWVRRAELAMPRWQS